jgi:hypothetical protein
MRVAAYGLRGETDVRERQPVRSTLSRVLLPSKVRTRGIDVTAPIANSATPKARRASPVKRPASSRPTPAPANARVIATKATSGTVTGYVFIGSFLTHRSFRSPRTPILSHGYWLLKSFQAVANSSGVSIPSRFASALSNPTNPGIWSTSARVTYPRFVVSSMRNALAGPSVRDGRRFAAADGLAAFCGGVSPCAPIGDTADPAARGTGVDCIGGTGFAGTGVTAAAGLPAVAPPLGGLV